jgi:hypothetical protein
LTLFWSIFCWFLIPNSPVGAWFLDEEDQYKAIERVKDNLTGIKNHHFKFYQMLEAFKDPKVWLLAAIQLTQNVPNGAVGSVSHQHPFLPWRCRSFKYLLRVTMVVSSSNDNKGAFV